MTYIQKPTLSCLSPIATFLPIGLEEDPDFFIANTHKGDDTICRFVAGQYTVEEIEACCAETRRVTEAFNSSQVLSERLLRRLMSPDKRSTTPSDIDGDYVMAGFYALKDLEECLAEARREQARLRLKAA